MILTLSKAYICSKSENYVDVIEELKKQFQIKVDEASKEPIELNVCDEDIDVLSKILAQVSTNSIVSNEQWLLVKEVFKCLRNCCVKNREIQIKLQNHSDLETLTLYFYEKFVNKDNLTISEMDCFKMLLQFLINLIVDNKITAAHLWQSYSQKITNYLKCNCDPKVIKEDDRMIFNNVLALLYNLLLQNHNVILDETITNLIFDIYDKMIAETGTEISEYVFFLMEHLINAEVYRKLPIKKRLIILQLIKDRLNSETFTLDQNLTDFLIEDFKKKSDCILKTVDSYLKNIEPIEVSLLLEVLATLSSKHDNENLSNLGKLANDKSLLINSCFLLKSIQSLGKENENNFTQISRLTNLDDSKDYNEHPAFGFKATLIQLIGNLCWKNKSNQDEVRELDCIPLLLDCCNMDARNPFIIQWTVLAIRNLCENNAQNQALIANMTRKNHVHSSVLDEFGLTLNEDPDGKNPIRIAPLERDL